YRARPLVEPQRLRATLLRTRNADATSPEVYNPDYLVKVQRAKGSLLPFFEGWKKVLPDLETRIVEGQSHFDLLANSPTVSAAPDSIAGDMTGSTASTERIAVVGMSARFTGCPSLDSFWQMLKEGRSAIGDFPKDRQWDASESLYIQQGGFLDNI